MTVCELPEVSDEAIIVAAHGFGKTIADRTNWLLLAAGARSLALAGTITGTRSPVPASTPSQYEVGIFV